ncbi:hypothetical protein FACS18948_6580 [Clostridia bacterium]|nr:hypothetical protein FACS18948_6580 [Clostridia bacterium]
MANSIALAVQWVPKLDEVYKLASLTANLDGSPELVQAGASANELRIPMLDMSPLADYSRNTGYATGDVTLTMETVTANFDKGRMFQVDALDDMETAGIAFGRLAGEFIRTKVAPYLDAFRLNAYATAAGVTSATGTLTTGAQVLTAIRAAVSAMDDAEVTDADKVLYIAPALLGAVEDLDTTASRAVLARFSEVIRTPQKRLNMQITPADTGDGYTAAGANINFIAAHRGAVIQFTKHLEPKIITPEINQTADAWKFGYRIVSIAKVYQNKVKGIYVNSVTPAP